MNSAERPQLQQVLCDRCDTIADGWYTAIAETNLAPHRAAKVRQRLVELTEQAIALLLTESFDRSQAQAIGVSLACLHHYIQPEALGRTQEVLACLLVKDLPTDQVVALQPRLATLLGELAVGFFQQAREKILAEQEQIRRALITERVRTEESLRTLAYKLGGRVRELNCLYGISDLVEKPGISLEEIIHKTVDLIPPAWQYPEITCARIILEGQESARTENFDATVVAQKPSWKQASDIVVHGERVGTVEVCYLEEKPENDEGPFLKEERSLLNAIAKRLGRIAERARVESQRDATLAAQQESEARYTLATRAARVGVWDWNVQTGEFYLDPNVKAILDYSDEEIPNNLDIWATYVHPDDRQPAMEAFQAHIEGQTPEYVYEHRMLHKDGSVRWILARGTAMRDAQGDAVRVVGTDADVTERVQAEEALRRRNRDLELINWAGQVFNSTLELDQMLATTLDELRHLLDVAACSVWLIDQATGELVCQQATGPRNDTVRGWRLAPGEGLAGWVVHHGEHLNVPDTRTDARHFKRVDRQTGVELRSILSVPLRVRREMIGVLQLGDTRPGRLDTAELTLAESLAATVAIAIENARLYEQARQDAETKAVLLHEVNHRVKNNLSAIVGLLYAEQRYADVEDQAVYQSILKDLAHRIQGLARVHAMLSAVEWAPLPLDELAGQIIRVALQILPRHKLVSVDVTPSSVQVVPKQANDLALVINELATNSAKHALSERDEGHIDVRIISEDEDDTVLLEFRDDGSGYPEEVLTLESYNVGLYLLQTLVGHGLRGELALRNDGGAVATIRFKRAVGGRQ